jgi:hypothetical protein
LALNLMLARGPSTSQERRTTHQHDAPADRLEMRERSPMHWPTRLPPSARSSVLELVGSAHVDEGGTW